MRMSAIKFKAFLIFPNFQVVCQLIYKIRYTRYKVSFYLWQMGPVLLRSKDTEASKLQVRLHFMEAFRNWYFNAKIVHYCYFHLHLTRLIYLRIGKTK